MSGSKEWDYIIVGGGSAGCVLANRLSANPAHRVLLLDAGRSDKHLFTRIPAGQMYVFPRTDMNWLYMAEPDPSRNNRVDIWPAGKIIGGGSAINGMMYVRGHKSDYDHWAERGNSGWAYDDVLPYFKRLEDSEAGDQSHRGRGGPQSVSWVRIKNPLNQAFVDSAQEVGIPFNADLNGASQEGVGFCQATQKRGWRQSTAQAFLRPAQGRPNLVIELGAQVSKVIVEDGRARGVSYVRNGATHEAAARQGVIVSAGAVASPKLLMLSGLGPAAQLQNFGIDVVADLPGVGQNLQEHPVVRMSFHVKNARTLTSDLRRPLYSLLHGLDYIFRGRGALATCIGHAQALARTRDGLEAPNAQLIFAPLSYDLTDKGPKPYIKPAVGFGIGLCRTQSQGEISLRSGAIEDPPVINHSLLDNPDDIAQLREACQLTRKIMHAKAFANYFVDERLPGTHIQSAAEWEDHIRDSAALMYHPCGTCKMGRDTLAVVDQNLKVRGVAGLWVTDASIFPTVPAGNINATCIMVGEKAADLILQDNSQ